MSGQQQRDGGGCGAFIAVAIVIGAVVAGVISIAALVDPFSWLPPIGEIFGDCRRSDVPGGDCDLSARFPGFWPHVLVNFIYAVATAGVLVWLGVTAGDFRQARKERFGDEAAVDRYGELRTRLTLVGSSAGILGLLPIVVAVA